MCGLDPKTLMNPGYSSLSYPMLFDVGPETSNSGFWFPDFSKPGSSFYNYKDNADVLRAALNYNTYPEERDPPQTETESIESTGGTPYAYISVPASPAIPRNALLLYGLQTDAQLEHGYVPQPDAGSSTNALAAFTNLYAARLNRNALIGPVD